MTDLFCSDHSISSYRLSLPGLQFDYQARKASFIRVPISSTEAFFIANSYDPAVMEINLNLKGERQLNLEMYTQTRVSFTLGASWTFLSAPFKDLEGKAFVPQHVPLP